MFWQILSFPIAQPWKLGIYVKINLIICINLWQTSPRIDMKWTKKSPSVPESWKYWKIKVYISTILGMLEIQVSIIARILEMRAAGGWAAGSRGCGVLPCIFFKLFWQFFDMCNLRQSGFSLVLHHFWMIWLQCITYWLLTGRRRRRQPNNCTIWPDPWTMTPRDQISRSWNPSLRLWMCSFRFPIFDMFDACKL